MTILKAKYSLTNAPLEKVEDAKAELFDVETFATCN
jgi:hypothetical protein